MASVRIETWENEYALYDYEVYRNGVLFAEDYNYTTEEAALTAARERL